jgi:hypothetical protein
MYAVSSPSDVYHLLTQAKARTLCGLFVVPIVIDRPVNTSALHLTSNDLTDRDMCKDCARIEQEEHQQR